MQVICKLYASLMQVICKSFPTKKTSLKSNPWWYETSQAKVMQAHRLVIFNSYKPVITNLCANHLKVFSNSMQFNCKSIIVTCKLFATLMQFLESHRQVSFASNPWWYETSQANVMQANSPLCTKTLFGQNQGQTLFDFDKKKFHHLFHPNEQEIFVADVNFQHLKFWATLQYY